MSKKKELNLEKSGDKGGNMPLEEVMKTYEQQLIGYACRILRDYSAAQDAAQETFIRYLRISRKDGAGSIVNVGAWLFRVTRNLCLDRLKSASKRFEVLCEDRNYLENAAVTERRPDAAIEENEEKAVLMDAINELGEKAREVLILKFEHGRSYAEIAEIMGLSQGNVGFILHNAVKKLSTSVKEKMK